MKIFVDHDSFPWLPSAAVLVIGGLWFWSWRQRRIEKAIQEAAKNWPEQDARVISTQIVEVEGGRHRSKHWDGLVTYSYVANEVEVGEYRHRFEVEEEADEWVRFVRGQTLRVRVDPEDPRRSRWLDESVAGVKSIDLPQRQSAAPIDIGGIHIVLSFAVLTVSIVGGVLAVAAQLDALSGGVFLQPRNSTPMFMAMHLGAMVCAVASVYVFRQRFPRSRKNAVYEQLSGPLVKNGLAVLGIYATCLFAWTWTNDFFGFETHADRSGTLMFSSFWLLFYVNSALNAWFACFPPRRAGLSRQDA